MKNLIIKSMHLENFKIFQNFDIDFGMNTEIMADNYKGKSTLFDAFFWVLFGKSSTGNSEGKQFQIRRRVDGVEVDRVPVVAEITLELDGKLITIRKTQEQKWVRKRSSEVETYEGDGNKYTWNEVDVKESEHKKRVAELIDEEVFKNITNPHAFLSKKQDEQRQFLTEKVARITDEEVLVRGGFTELASMLESNTLEEIKAINKKALKGYKEDIESIPLQIAERSRDITDYDFAEQELALSALKEQLADVENKLNDTSKMYKSLNELKIEVSNTKTKIVLIDSKIENEYQQSIDAVKKKVAEYSNQLELLQKEKAVAEQDIILKNTYIESLNKSVESKRLDYSNLKNTVFDANSLSCPTCGQALTEEQKTTKAKEFEDSKADKLDLIAKTGNSEFLKAKQYKEEVEKLTSKISNLEEQITEKASTLFDVQEELKNFKHAPNSELISEKTDLESTLKALEFSLAETQESLADTDKLKESLSNEKQSILEQIQVVSGVLGAVSKINDAKDRVAELNEKLKLASIEAANCEKIELMIESFEKTKIAMLTDTINSYFSVINWSFERRQKNGGTENYCSCYLNGIEYGDNTLSSTQKLMAGLDMIGALQKVYGITAPIWIDNKERYNDHNIPKMDCQVIKLTVSKDKEIVVNNIV